jgi:hypothetical protein
MSALGDKLRRIPRALPARVAAAAVSSVEAKAKASVPVRTGRLRDSITATAAGDSIVVSAPVPYAPFVDEATEHDYTPELAAAVRGL